jgi:HSP20 family protein
MAKKPSFFERLTGTVNVDDYGMEESIEVETVSTGSDIDPELENDWMEEDNNEGQLTVDVYQNPNEIIIKALVAGVRPENLDVSITRDMVTIKGKREEAKQITEDNYFYKELYWGSFSRTILLPQEIEVDESTAGEKHGLLTLTMPKVNKEKQTKLKIKTG